MDPPGYRVLAGDAGSAVIVHVPHASVLIPPGVRQGILIDDAALAFELAQLTDAHTEVMARLAAGTAAMTPWSFVNLLSRLVIDPERFPDERETMREVGMGAVYSSTHDGRPLRADDPQAERLLVDQWFNPYAQAMTALVDERLAAVGRVTIIDVHSYPSERLPYERGGERRPAICLGVDQAHTPDWLLAAGRETFASCGDVAVDTPFAGCYVPLKHYGREPRVTALMVEVRRDLYMIEPGGPPTEGLPVLSRSLANLIDRLARATP